MATQKRPITKKQIETADNFERTRENMAEFETAAKASSLIRLAFLRLCRPVIDKRLFPKLNKQLMEIVQTDPVNDRGLRKVSMGDLSLLEGFDLNDSAPLFNSLSFGYEGIIDRPSGGMKLNLPACIPKLEIPFPIGSTHFRCSVGAIEIDFESETFKNNIIHGDYLLLDNAEIGPLNLSCTATPNSTIPLFLGLSIGFSQLVNGKHYALKSADHNALGIVKVSQP